MLSWFDKNKMNFLWYNSLCTWPESDRYACSFDSDSESISRNKYGINRRYIIYYIDNCEYTTEEDAYRIQFEKSPMVAACEGGNIDIVEYLVEYGYNVDHSDTNLPTNVT
jgi:hypothetical protein